MKRTQYSSDLSESEWLLLKDLIPTAKIGGRPQAIDFREILNAVFYVLRAGCAWRLLPHDFPKWKSGLSLLARVAHQRLVGTDQRDLTPQRAKKGGSQCGAERFSN